VWHELLTTDPDAAIPFYCDTVGWSLMPWDRDPGYRMFAWNDVPMAGLMRLPEEARLAGAPPHWLTYVSVRDVEATLADAVAMGGCRLVAPMDIPTVGCLAVLADPEGTVFAVFRPEGAGPATDELTVGDFSWHDLAADDWQAAWAFYQALFGWEFDSQFDMGQMGTYWMFRRPGSSRTLGGIYRRPPEVAATHWLPYIHVRDVDRVAALVRQHGGEVLNGPIDVPGGDRVAQFLDPQGAFFAVHARPVQLAMSLTEAAPPEPEPRPRRARPATKAPPPVKPRGRPVKKKPVKKR